MTTPDIAAIRSRLAAATPGVWVAEMAVDDEWDVVVRDETVAWDNVHWVVQDADTRATAALIAHAPADLRALCDEVARLRAGVDRLISYLGDVKASLSFSHDIDGAEYAASDAEAFAVTLLAAQPAACTE